MAQDLKTFKDANGQKVEIGHGVSMVKPYKNFPQNIMIVKSITRSRRKTNITLWDNVTQYHYHMTGKDVVSEE